jgi:pimeloyl-ACP methyl ester carboxylesterase
MKITQKLLLKYIRTKLRITAVLSKRRAARLAFKLFSTPLLSVKQKHTFKNSEALQFLFNNKNVTGYRFNHPQNKKALVLHGFNSSANKFENYVQPLVDKNYEVLAFDAPAHGNSEGKTTNAVEYSEMIIKIIELYGPVNSFIAHSFGGIAISLAMEKMPHDATTKIVLIAPATETTSAIDSAFKLLKLNDPHVRTEFEKLIFNISGKEAAWFSIRRAVKNIKAQILWLHDEEDDVTPLQDALKVKEDKHANIKFIITTGLGHRKIYHDAAVKNGIINFL